MIIVILAMFATASSIIAAIFSLLKVWNKQKAEHVLIKKQLEAIIKRIIEVGMEKDREIRNLRESIEYLSKKPPDLKILEKKQKILDSMLESLSESDRQQISEGLHQPLERGRADYTAKLLTKIEHEVKMIELGIYRTKDGKEYDCLFFKDDRTAQAIGPLPEGDQIGSRGVKFSVTAKTKQEAKQNLVNKIGPGKYV